MQYGTQAEALASSDTLAAQKGMEEHLRKNQKITVTCAENGYIVNVTTIYADQISGESGQRHIAKTKQEVLEILEIVIK